MRINEVHKTRQEFLLFLQQLSRNPFATVEAARGSADHVVIRVQNEAGEATSSLHIVADQSVYRALKDIPRAGYLRDARAKADRVSVFTASPEEHHAKKQALVDSFKSWKLLEGAASLVETIDAGLEKWKIVDRIFPFSEVQKMATSFIAKFAFGETPSPEDCITLARGGIVSNDKKLWDSTDPRHFPCLRPLSAGYEAPVLSVVDQEIFDAKQAWIQNLVVRRIATYEKDGRPAEPRDLLDAILDQALASENEPANVRKRASKDASAFITAASETTPTHITYALYMAAHDRELQDNLRAELRASGFEVGKPMPNILALAANRSRMPVLQNLIADAFTHYPPLHFSATRQVPEAVEAGGIHFRKDDYVIFHLSHMKQYFHGGAYGCPGKPMHDIEANVTLAKVFSAFRLEPFEGQGIPEPRRNAIVNSPSVDVPLKVYTL